MNKVFKYLLIGTAISIVALAQPKVDPKFDFGQAKAGADLTVPGTGFPSTPAGIVLSVQPRGPKINAKSSVPALVFPLPALEPGDYTATISFPDVANPVPLTGTLTVKAASAQMQTLIPALPKGPAPPISDIAPPTAYEDNKGQFSFDIYGENFPKPAENTYGLKVLNRVIDPLEVIGTNGTCTGKKPCLQWLSAEHIAVSGITRIDYQSKTPVQLRIDNEWVGPKELTFSKWQRHWPFLAAGGFVAASFVLIMGVFRLRRGSGGGHDVITLFLLDADTNSYSLSKFQVFSWLMIIVFAYVYVLFSGITIQGNLTWPEFPGSLAGMFGLSLGAMVASSAVTETKGNKGAGAKGPSFADFFSSGGVVAADRFQFFLWTLVGFFGYLSLLWFSDPAKITEVPKVPDGLLYLMGLSAGGYVGGKLARKPGPNITGLKASVDFSSHTLSLRVLGDNLSPAATFQIQGQEVKTVVRPVTIVAPPETNPAFATEIVVAITSPDPTWLTRGAHTLRVINDDGQFAEKDYTIGSAVTGPVTIAAAAAAGSASITIPRLDLASGIPTVSLEVKDSVGTVFKLPGFTPAVPPAPTVVNVEGANPAGPAQVTIAASDGSSVKVATA